MKTHLLVLFLIFHSHIETSRGLPKSCPDSPRNGDIESVVGGGGAAAEEFEMDSEVSRRMLNMQRKYISYETLKRDAVPCSTPGASYYNCGSSQANRYSRGCEIITRCARSIRE